MTLARLVCLVFHVRRRDRGATAAANKGVTTTAAVAGSGIAVTRAIRLRAGGTGSLVHGTRPAEPGVIRAAADGGRTANGQPDGPDGVVSEICTVQVKVLGTCTRGTGKAIRSFLLPVSGTLLRIVLCQSTRPAAVAA